MANRGAITSRTAPQVEQYRARSSMAAPQLHVDDVPEDDEEAPAFVCAAVRGPEPGSATIFTLFIIPGRAVKRSKYNPSVLLMKLVIIHSNIYSLLLFR